MEPYAPVLLPDAGERPPRPPKGRWRDDLERVTLVLLGLVSTGVAVVVLAQPALTLTQLLWLLGGAVALNSARGVVVGGLVFLREGGGWAIPRWTRGAYQKLGLLGIGLLAVAIAAAAVLDPNLTTRVAVTLLAFALIAQGLGRVAEGTGANVAVWRRGSSIVTGALVVGLVVAAVAFEGFALLSFAILVGVILLVSGIETVVDGLRPTEPRQFTLLKLVLFAAFYGLVLINWIDLFGKSVPGYGLWLILTYMAPFTVVLVFVGWQAWPLATSLGLLVSLMNDVGYYFIGNLLFGFHENLGPWISGQLGLEGTKLVTIFEGGVFTLDVTSWMMGLSIYARAGIVAAILYYWWRHPTGLPAPTGGPGGPSSIGAP